MRSTRVRVAVALLAVGFAASACGGEVPLRTESQSSTTTTAAPAASQGLDCSANDLIVTQTNTYGQPSEGANRVIDAANSPEEAAEKFRRERFPGSREPARRTAEDRYTVSERGRGRVLVIFVEQAENGWYVPGYSACESFQQRTKPEGT